MTIRYTAQPKTRFGLFPGLPSGYQNKSTPEISVPSVGIEDVDKALFNLFNEQIPLVVAGNGTDARRVPVVFFAGEKWALNKRLRALRDKSGALILPLITAVRTTVMQDPVQDITGRGTNQQTGEIIIHRRLDKSDRAYQGLINRMMLKHQPNVAVNPDQADVGQLTTLRDIGELENDPIVRQGGLMLPDRRNNVYETIVVPSPQFFTAQYDITFWTQYTSHMNQMLEAVMASFLPQGNAWRIESPKGYWFVATVDGNLYSADTNIDDYSQEERLIKYKFVVKVPGYILASSVPGAPVPIKRYVSSPTITFETGIASSESSLEAGEQDPFIGADDPTLPLDSGSEAYYTRRDQRNVNGTRLFPGNPGLSVDDPALGSLRRGTAPPRFKKVTGVDKNGRTVTRLLRIRSVNSFTGETVFAPDATLEGLTIVVTED